MSRWPSTKARQVLTALLRIGWTIKRQSGTSHRVLSKPGWPDFIFAFHDKDDIGPKKGSRGLQNALVYHPMNCKPIVKPGK